MKSFEHRKSYLILTSDFTLRIAVWNDLKKLFYDDYGKEFYLNELRGVGLLDDVKMYPYNDSWGT